MPPNFLASIIISEPTYNSMPRASLFQCLSMNLMPQKNVSLYVIYLYLPDLFVLQIKQLCMSLYLHHTDLEKCPHWPFSTKSNTIFT